MGDEDDKPGMELGIGIGTGVIDCMTLSCTYRRIVPVFTFTPQYGDYCTFWLAFLSLTFG